MLPTLPSFHKLDPQRLDVRRIQLEGYLKTITSEEFLSDHLHVLGQVILFLSEGEYERQSTELKRMVSITPSTHTPTHTHTHSPPPHTYTHSPPSTLHTHTHTPHPPHFTHTHSPPSQVNTLLNPLKRVATLTRGALKSSGQSSSKMSPVTVKKQPSSETPKPPGEEVKSCN